MLHYQCLFAITVDGGGGLQLSQFCLGGGPTVSDFENPWYSIMYHLGICTCLIQIKFTKDLKEREKKPKKKGLKILKGTKSTQGQDVILTYV